MKICIIGGLGYIGCSLVDTFRDSFKEDPNLEVWVVDKEFIPQRIVTLQGNGLNFKYVQADINDMIVFGEDMKSRLNKTWKEILEGADVVFHLASPVEAESSVNKEAETWRTIKGASIDLMRFKPKDCVLFFASTANVFGGILPGERNAGLTEEDMPFPIYPYAQSKASTEEFIRLNQDIKNVVVCRFGTAYGYSDGIRFNLVTNIFFKKMLEGKEIEVYGDGSNLRPVCHVRDIARALRFLADKYREGAVRDKETFHVVQANYAVRDLARIIAGFNSACSVVHPAGKPAPFMSYALSNKKICDLGFKFEESLAKSTREMLQLFKAAGGIK